MSDAKVTPLGRKIVAAILGTTLLALALSFFLNAIPLVHAYRQEGADKARTLAGLMAASLVAPVDFDDPEAAAENLRTLSLTPDVLGAAVYLADGSTLAVWGAPLSCEVPPKPGVRSALSSLTVVSPVPSGRAGCVVALDVSLAGQWGLLRSYLVSGALILLGVFVFCFKLSVYLMSLVLVKIV